MWSGGTNYYLWTNQETPGFTTPFLRAGLEWKPQARFGWNLSANWNVLKGTYKQKIYIRKDVPSATEELTLWESRFPALYFDTSVALYF